MFRLILLAAIGFFLYRIVQSTARMFSGYPKGSGRPGGSAPPPRQTPPPNEFKNVQDAEFEDITPKKEKAGDPSDSGP
jgi:hypothetical protein